MQCESSGSFVTNSEGQECSKPYKMRLMYLCRHKNNHDAVRFGSTDRDQKAVRSTSIALIHLAILQSC